MWQTSQIAFLLFGTQMEPDCCLAVATATLWYHVIYICSHQRTSEINELKADGGKPLTATPQNAHLDFFSDFDYKTGKHIKGFNRSLDIRIYLESENPFVEVLFSDIQHITQCVKFYRLLSAQLCSLKQRRLKNIMGCIITKNQLTALGHILFRVMHTWVGSSDLSFPAIKAVIWAEIPSPW